MSMTLKVVAVLADIHPKAIVEWNGLAHVVSYPDCRLAGAREVSMEHVRAAIAKHGYESFDEPVLVDSEDALRELLSRHVTPDA